MILALLLAIQAGGIEHQTALDLHGRTILVQNLKDGDGRGCTLRIEGQDVPTYGHGDLEAYTCDGLAAAGRLEGRRGRERVGLIYDVGGSPTVAFRTALILERIRGRWRIERGSPGRLDGTPQARSMASLRRWERSGNTIPQGR